MSTYIKPKYILDNREYSQEELALLAVAVASEKKASRPIILDLRNLASAFTEIFTLVSAANNRQVYAIAEDIRLFFKNTFNLLPVSIDGLDTCTWVLIDYGFMFVHVFQEPTRDAYQLEQLWNKARPIDCQEDVYTSLYKQALNSLQKIQSITENNSSIEIES
jgi:ribosome-associated protein